MSTYARINGGTVAELFTPPVNVPITDCFHAGFTWIDVSTVVPAPQEGWTATQSGEAWSFAQPSPPVLTPAQQANNLLAAGLTVTSTSGAWAATFPAATDATGTSIWTLVLSELAALTMSSGTVFADGAETAQWPGTDQSNNPKLYALTPTQFQAFARALGAFVAVCRNVINGVPGSALPPAEATIA